jgi:hypothetical protein
MSMRQLLEKIKNVLLPIDMRDLQPDDLAATDSCGNSRTANSEITVDLDVKGYPDTMLLHPCPPIECGPECAAELHAVPIVIVPAELFNALAEKMQGFPDAQTAVEMYGDLGQIVMDLLASITFPETVEMEDTHD